MLLAFSCLQGVADSWYTTPQSIFHLTVYRGVPRCTEVSRDALGETSVRDSHKFRNCQVRTVEQVRQVLEGTQALQFSAAAGRRRPLQVD